MQNAKYVSPCKGRKGHGAWNKGVSPSEESIKKLKESWI